MACRILQVGIQQQAKSISTLHRQTPFFIKSCSKIAQFLLLSDDMIAQFLLLSDDINGPFCSGHFNPFKSFFSTMDLDSHYYSSRCKNINGLWVFKGSFMTFVGGDSDH